MWATIENHQMTIVGVDTAARCIVSRDVYALNLLYMFALRLGQPSAVGLYTTEIQFGGVETVGPDNKVMSSGGKILSLFTSSISTRS